MLGPSLYAYCRKPINCRTYQIYLCKAPMRQSSINKTNYKDRSIFKSRLLQKMMHSILRNIFSEMLWFQHSLYINNEFIYTTNNYFLLLYLQNLSVELQLENHAEFSHDHFKGQVDRAAGARYGTGERALW